MTRFLVTRKVAHISVIMCCLLLALPTANAAVGVLDQEITYPEDLKKAFSQNPDLESVTLGDITYYRPPPFDGVHPFGTVPSRWPGGRLIYQFDNKLPSYQRQKFIEHCKTWENNTPITCVERKSGERNYIVVSEHSGEGCKGPDGKGNRVSCSALGMRVCAPNVGCPQELQILVGNWDNTRVVPHEIGHALGLVHEHQRPDRERFVYIVTANIQTDAIHNFVQENNAQTFTDYDFASVMHYGPCAFAKNKTSCDWGDADEQTIIPRACGTQTVQAGPKPTQLDFDGITQAYGGALAKMLPRKRMAECGTNVYSLPQLQAVCPTGCAQVGDTKYTKLEEKYDRTCGFFSGANDWKAYCRNEHNKEFVRETFDTDPSWDCFPGKLNERWVWCGCSQVEVQAECIDITARIDKGKLRVLQNGENPKDREAANIMLEFERLISQGAVRPDLREPLLKVLIDNYGRTRYVQELENVRCLTRVLLASKRLYVNDYQLDWNALRALLSSAGFKT